MFFLIRFSFWPLDGYWEDFPVWDDNVGGDRKRGGFNPSIFDESGASKSNTNAAILKMSILATGMGIYKRGF